MSIFSVGIGEDVPLDGTQEYSVLTNNYSAEYGRASGGVINVTPRPAPTASTAPAWEFNRLSAYTANTYGNDAANGLGSGVPGSLPDPKGTYTRNQFGYAAGGPIKKNKMFIFESTEWTRVRSAATESEEDFDPAFIALMPVEHSGILRDLRPNDDQVRRRGLYCCARLRAPAQLLAWSTAPHRYPPRTPMFDTVNFQAPFDAGGGTPSKYL